MQDVIAQVQELGVLDPAAQEHLLENLHETPPELWPLVVQQVRAAVAYRQQADRREGARPPCPAPTGSSPQPGPAADRMVMRPETTFPNGAPPKREVQPTGASQEPDGPDNRVVTASYESELADDWQQYVAEAVRVLESELSPAPQSDEEVARHARLRMLYLIAGRREEALRPIPAIAPSTQDFWSKELYGLATLLDTERIAEPTRRAAEAQRHLDDAVARLGESSPLVVHNLAFVTDVESYGAFTPFDKYEFAPGQKVLLYAEVDNYKAKQTSKGHHTALRSSYQIFDSCGRRVAYHEFSTNEEYCRNRRRDFFIGYEFSLPERIYPGEHVLELTVEDLNGGKIGQSTIRFTIVAGGR